MVEYFVKIYNEETEEFLIMENVHKFDIHNFMNEQVKEFGLIIIEKHTKKEEKEIITPVLALFDINKWQHKKRKYINNKTITILNSKNNTITINNDCRIKKCKNQQDIIDKFEKIQNNYYFMDKETLLYEDYLKNKPFKMM